MSIRLIATLVAATLCAAPALAQSTTTTTTPKPAATTTTPVKPTVTAPVKPAVTPAATTTAAPEDDGKTSKAEIAACNAKWKEAKAKAGAKTDLKAYYTFMAGCL